MSYSFRKMIVELSTSSNNCYHWLHWTCIFNCDLEFSMYGNLIFFRCFNWLIFFSICLPPLLGLRVVFLTEFKLASPTPYLLFFISLCFFLCLLYSPFILPLLDMLLSIRCSLTLIKYQASPDHFAIYIVDHQS